MTKKHLRPRSSFAGNALTIVTVGMLVLSIAIVGRFALMEAKAKSELKLFPASLRGFDKSESVPIDLKTWLEKSASKEDSDAWGRILNEVSGVYFERQLKNLWMSVSESLEDHIWLTEKKLVKDPKNVAFVWQVEPDLVSEFIEFTQPLRQRIHQLSSDEKVVFLPLRHQGAATTLTELQTISKVVNLIYLENEDSIRRKDRDGVQRALRTLNALESKFSYPVPGSILITVQTRIFFASAVHRALDAEMIELDAWPYWMSRLRNRPDLRAEFEREQVIGQWQSLEHPAPYQDSNTENFWDRPLPSQQLAQLRKQLASRDSSAYDAWFLALQDYQQSAVVRLAILRYSHEKNRLPHRLEDLPSSWITPNDWTNREGKSINYVLSEDQSSAFISISRLSTRNVTETAPLASRYYFYLTPPEP